MNGPLNNKIYALFKCSCCLDNIAIGCISIVSDKIYCVNCNNNINDKENEENYMKKTKIKNNGFNYSTKTSSIHHILKQRHPGISANIIDFSITSPYEKVKNILGDKALGDLIKTEYLMPGNSTKTCSICLSDVLEGEKIIRMPCKHTFHTHCIVEWLRLDSSCPLCREEM
jgi:hypothetical protein